MKRIKVLTYHYGVNGSYMNMLDINDMFIGYDVEYYFRRIEDLENIEKKSYRKYGINKLSKYGKGIVFSDVIITDISTIFKLIRDNPGDKFVGKKLIIMDNLEMTYHLNNEIDMPYYYGYDIEECLKSLFVCKEILFMMPRNNKEKFEKRYRYDVVEYYKGINVEKLGMIPEWEIDDICYRDGGEVDGCVKVEDVDIFKYRGFNYYRREKYGYYEQFGRLVYEFMLMGRDVYYSGSLDMRKDGFYDYMNHYGIYIDGNRLRCDNLKEKICKNNERFVKFVL